MFLLPKCGQLIGDALSPVSSHLKDRIQKWFPKKKELYIAVDTGVLMNHKSVVVTGLILMPIALFLAFLIPGNKTLPLGDLPNLISIMSVSVLVSRGNVFRSVLTGIPIVAGFLYISSEMAGLYTRLSAQVNLDFGEGQIITAFTDGGNPIRYWLYYLYKGNMLAIIVMPIILGMMYLSWKKYKKMINEEKTS
jgi:PTS system galactitol-specific IIC component